MAVSTVSQTFAFSGGFFSDSAPAAPVRQDAIISPSKNVLYTSTGQLRSFYGVEPLGTLVPGKTFKFKVDTLGSSVRFPFGSTGSAGLGARESSTGFGRGTAFLYSGSALFYIGRGQLMSEGRLTGVTATRRLQYLVPGTDGKYDLASPGAVNREVGVAAPISPAVIAATGTGDVKGVISVKFTIVRPIAGSGGIESESNPSPVSNVLDFGQDGRQAIISFPVLPPDGSFYRVYATFSGFGATGDWNFLQAVTAEELTTIGGLDLAIQANWLDATLAGTIQPPDNHGIPPSGDYAFPARDVLVIVNAGGSPVLQSSLPGSPESFDADNSFVPLPELATGVLADVASGAAWIGCPSSMHLVTYTGAPSGPPIDITRIWAAHGVADQRNMCLAGADLYAFTNEGAARTGGPSGEPDITFAQPVRSYMTGWKPAGVRVGYNPSKEYVVFAHGHECLIYYTGLNRWSAPIDLRQYLGECCVANFYTRLNRLYMDWFTRRDNSLYDGIKFAVPSITTQYYFPTEFDFGAASVFTATSTTGSSAAAGSHIVDPSWSVHTDWAIAGTPMRKTLHTFHLIGESDFVSFGLQTNLNAPTSFLSEIVDGIYKRVVSSSPDPTFVSVTTARLLEKSALGVSAFVEEARQVFRDLFASTDYTDIGTSNSRFAQDVHYGLYEAEATVSQSAAIESLLGTLTRAQVLDREMTTREFNDKWRWIYGRSTSRAPSEAQGVYFDEGGRFDGVIKKINVKNAITLSAFVNGKGRDMLSLIVVNGVQSQIRSSDAGQVQVCPAAITASVAVGEVTNGRADVTFTFSSPNAEEVLIRRHDNGEVFYFDTESSDTTVESFPEGDNVVTIIARARNCPDITRQLSFFVGDIVLPVATWTNGTTPVGVVSINVEYQSNALVGLPAGVTYLGTEIYRDSVLITLNIQDVDPLFIDSPLMPSTTYVYRLRNLFDVNGESAFTDSINYTWVTAGGS